MKCREFEQKGAFEKYLRGELPEDESVRLESHCFDCDTCFAQLQLTESLIGVIRSTPRDKLFPKPQPKAPREYRFALVLAGIAAIMLIGILLAPLHWSTSGQYAALAELEAPRYIPGQIRGGGEPAADPSFSTAMSLYQRGEYIQAAARLEESLRRFPQNPQATFYSGVSLLMSRKPKPALACFEALIRQQTKSYLDDSLWYAAMACLQLGDGPNALRHLQILTARESRHSRRAGDLISRIREQQK